MEEHKHCVAQHCAYFNHSVKDYAICQHPDQPKTWLKKDKICMLHFQPDNVCTQHVCYRYLCNRYIPLAIPTK